MATLKQQNDHNIGLIVVSTTELAEKYETRSKCCAETAWAFWTIVKVVGIAITLLELVGNGGTVFKTIISCFGLGITFIGLLQDKLKPSTRGQKYKASAATIRKLGRKAQGLRFSPLSDEDIATRLEEIFSEIDGIDLSMYIGNMGDQGMMKKGFGNNGPPGLTPAEPIEVDEPDAEEIHPDEIHPAAEGEHVVTMGG